MNKKVKVYGYSERGIFNSIVFWLKEHPEKIAGFLSTLGINDEFFKDDNTSFTFLNEQSFSDFGDNDWTIIAEKDGEQQVIFIEGKVKTFNGKFSLDKNFEDLKGCKPFDGISSNIFVQLYYKLLLTKVINGKDTTGLDIHEVFKKSNKAGESIERKIGENGIVHKAIDLIKGKGGAVQYFYVAILPDELTSEAFREKLQELSLFDSNEISDVRCKSWASIEEFFKGLGDEANAIIENFKYNEGQIY
jgi:hypothetical protein